MVVKEGNVDRIERVEARLGGSLTSGSSLCPDNPQLKLLQLALTISNPPHIAEWTAFADFLVLLPKLNTLDLAVCKGLREISLAFLLQIRQQCFDLDIYLDSAIDTIPLLLTICEQNRLTQTPPIFPFALTKLEFEFSYHLNIPPEYLYVLGGLGRAGPETIKTLFEPLAYDISIHAQVWDNFWICDWQMFMPEWEPDWDAYESEEVMYELMDDVYGSVKVWVRRNRNLRDGTRRAATDLLRAARPLLFAQAFSSSLSPSKVASTPAFANSASCPSILPAQSSFRFSSTSDDILDAILSHLSPGCLSAHQHRLVMNFAGDRSTLRTNKATNSKLDFLRQTDCLRWESELEKVNMGLGYK
jgi:hypothetical protein